MTPHKSLYIIVAIMLLVAREDIDGIRIRDRLEVPVDREWLV
jgi:hypothetical protein